MARYINANEIRYHQKENIDGYVYSEYVSKDEIDAMPAADVEPVRRGKWLKTDAYPHRVYCSECYKTYVTNEEVIQGRGWAPVYCTEAEFCPHCGAKMGGEENGV